MGTELIVFDTVFAHEVETEDVVRFTSNDEVREGFVFDTQDNSDTITLILFDDDNETVEYEIDADQRVHLLTREDVVI